MEVWLYRPDTVKVSDFPSENRIGAVETYVLISPSRSTRVSTGTPS